MLPAQAGEEPGQPLRWSQTKEHHRGNNQGESYNPHRNDDDRVLGDGEDVSIRGMERGRNMASTLVDHVVGDLLVGSARWRALFLGPASYW